MSKDSFLEPRILTPKFVKLAFLFQLARGPVTLIYKFLGDTCQIGTFVGRENKILGNKMAFTVCIFMQTERNSKLYH